LELLVYLFFFVVTRLYTLCNVFLRITIWCCLSAWRQHSTGCHLGQHSHSRHCHVSM